MSLLKTSVLCYVKKTWFLTSTPLLKNGSRAPNTVDGPNFAPPVKFLLKRVALHGAEIFHLEYLILRSWSGNDLIYCRSSRSDKYLVQFIEQQNWSTQRSAFRRHRRWLISRSRQPTRNRSFVTCLAPIEVETSLFLTSIRNVFLERDKSLGSLWEFVWGVRWMSL